MFIPNYLSRLSQLRRSNLQRRLIERCDHAETYHGPESHEYRRALAVLGRFSALTA